MPRPPTPVPFIASGNPEVDRLQRFVAQALPGKQDTWATPKLLNGWANFGGSLMPAGFMKDAQGFVHLRGVIKSGTINTTAFVIPVGYRPSAAVQFPSLDGVNVAGLVQVDTGGNVVPQIGSNAVYRLDGITFDTR